MGLYVALFEWLLVVVRDFGRSGQVFGKEKMTTEIDWKKSKLNTIWSLKTPCADVA